ncbi:nucleotide-binding universal stress UspA family protein [Pontibacter ummariensis]|uniref:Nucleotide-binding universal stress protein, UspA family n=1 Tax=Pontibacter ummariensis TaxID=1610492 RepID=A0A239KJE5_9BACT|nr:universal stress protein [Pontibacter ummariensis]PRY05714.1 nucleotide-binding universal stress UspA family protein [Pontibacter ummariensis]SNT18110.1 Nucleotide-binding universal stress protein, UspA family [Pontibacter ummariensis]
MRKILCPTDFSATSGKAIDYAVYIAQHAGAHLSLVHVIHLPIVDTSETAMVASELLGEQMRDAAEQLQAICRHLEEKYGANRDGEFTCDYILKEALLTDITEQLTAEEGYDLIVMGTTGRDNTLEELLIGSNTETIIEEVECPVLSIPATGTSPKIEKIIYASDYSKEDQVALGKVVELGSYFSAEIEVVHVVKSEEDHEKAEAFWKELQHQFPGVPLTFHEVHNRHRAEGLKAYYKETGGDVLAIVRKKKGFLRELFTQSLAEKMTYQAEVPLLVLHGKKA